MFLSIIFESLLHECNCHSDISNIPIKSDNSFVLPFQPTLFMPTFLRIVFDYYIVVLPVLEVK